MYVQWTGYVRAVWGSGQTGRTGGKCWFVGIFVFGTVQLILFWLPNEGKGDG